MSGIIRRKLRETWREAMAARFAEKAPERAEEGLAAFDAAVSAGTGEAETVYAILSSHGLLWKVEGAGFTAAGSEPGTTNRHSVPSV